MSNFVPKGEMFWRVDPAVDAARKLPEWKALHRVLGQSSVCVDHIEREGKRGQYRADLFAMVRAGQNWFFKLLATGRSVTVVGAIADGYRQCGVVAPGVQEMLDRGLEGAPVVAPDGAASAVTTTTTTTDDDPFEELFS